MNSRPEVAIAVVSYNTRNLLLECLDSIIQSTGETEIELIVVDNASEDGSLESVREAYPQAATIGNDANLGFGAACNQAIRATTSPLILLLNSDARLTRQAYRALSDLMSLEGRCGAAGCRLVNGAGRPMVNTRNFLTPLNQALEQAGITNRLASRHLRRTHSPRVDEAGIDCTVDWIDGACLMLRRAALEEVGLFDERFFMYSEDEDLCLRLRKGGWTVCYSAAGTAFHYGGASSAKNRTEMLFHFYYSQRLFLCKHRGRASASAHLAMMRGVLGAKLLLAPLLPGKGRRKELTERLAALKRAAAARYED